MHLHEEYLDQLDHHIAQLFQASQEAPIPPTNYAFFYQADERTPYWVIILFFKDTSLLKEAISDGVCYQMRNFFLEYLDQVDDLKKVILFEVGNLPSEESEVQLYFEKMAQKTEAMSKENAYSATENCSICGHPFAQHQMRGIPNEEMEAPTAGWMQCEEADCLCFRTWSLET